MKIESLSCHAALLVLIVALTGCTMKVGSMIPNDRFAYPNSNVEPLGKVQASVSKWSVVVPITPTKELFEELRAEAAKQKGGDMIINAKMTTDTLMIPLYVLYIYRTEVTLEGTAAKQTIGRQELK